MFTSKILTAGAGPSAAASKAARYAGLSFHYILQLLAVGALLSVLLIGQAFVQQKRAILKEMEQRGVLLGESLAGACSLPYFMGDGEALRFIVLRAGQLEDVVSIALLDSRGNMDPVAAVGRPEPPRLRAPDRPEVWSDARSIHVTAPLSIERRGSAGLSMLSGEDEAAAEPSRTTFLGHVYVVLSLERAMASLWGQVWESLLATTAILLLGSAVVVLFFRRTILRPIQRLIAAMRDLRGGNLAARLDDPASGSEMVELTRSFNEMTRDLRRAEEELKEINAELESRVQQRTGELKRANEDLRESQEKVVRSEKLAAIGQLASGVGHELRNPLGAIQNVIYYLRDSLSDNPALKQDPALPELLDIAQKEIKGATNILSDLLDFSRVVRLAPASCAVETVLEETLQVLQVPPSVKVIKDWAAGIPAAVMDHQKMKQVFTNLAQNAIQAMPLGGELRISARLESGDRGPGVAVEFKDTGEGISPEFIKKIFEPLFTTKAKGTGLGLAICQGIVEAHGGRIQVASELGKGSAFTVLIPLKEPSHDHERSQ
ncbi:MAG: sensor histidine kinase [Elusimicrobiota bacterium]